MAWISVDERLPEMKEPYPNGPLRSANVLITSGHYVSIGRLGQTYEKRITRWQDSNGHVVVVTHWMPLPDLPTKEDTCNTHS